jgi:hypothetical protein
MSDNWFVQHPQVMRYILEMESMRKQYELPTAFANPISIPMEDRLIHWEGRPFCDDMTCPCHTDSEVHECEIMQPWIDGLLTEAESDRLFYGKQV